MLGGLNIRLPPHGRIDTPLLGGWSPPVHLQYGVDEPFTQPARMRIALVNSYYPPVAAGGVETVVHALAQGLMGEKHEVRVFTTGHTRGTRSVDGVPVTVTPHHNVIWAPDAAHASKLRVVGWNLVSLWNPPGAEDMAAELAEFGPDVIHLHNIAELSPLLYLALRRRLPSVPVVQTLHGFWHTHVHQTYLDEHRGLLDRLRGHYLMGLTRRGVDHFVTPSQFVADAFVRMGLASAGQFSVVPNASSSDVRSVSRQSRPEGRDPLRVLYLGQLLENKGVRTLLKAVEAVPQARLEIAGWGPLEAEAAATPRTACLGWISGPAKNEALRRNDVLVFPSECNETFGISLLEGMQAGLCVVASRVGAVPEIVQDGDSGVIFEPGDGVALARILSELAGCPSAVRDLGRRAQLRAEEFGTDRLVERHQAVYEAVVREYS